MNNRIGRHSKSVRLSAAVLGLMLFAATATGAHPHAAPRITSLTNPAVEYRIADSHHVTLQRAGVAAVIVDNAAVDVPELPGHRAGYNGIASLKHVDHDTNLFVPPYAGLNFEHIHDGTKAMLKEKFEPRKFPMQLRIIDEFTVEVYEYTDPWYYGTSHSMALVLMFRDRDQVWFAQSPSGGGEGNPAWDFQWFIPDYRVGEAYGFVMRAAYIPFESREQIERATRGHRDALSR